MRVDMYRKHPLQQFLDRHRLSQTELAKSIEVSRETVNRWIRGRTVPEGRNLLRTITFAKRFEPSLEAHELFPTRADTPAPATEEEVLCASWGHECALCRVPWDLATEHLPLALLHPEIGSHPIGDLCESCARQIAGEHDNEPPALGGLARR